MTEKNRIGILTGGGDCPGLNAGIRAAAKTAIKEGYDVIGIRNGWKGFLENNTEKLDRNNTSGIIGEGTSTRRSFKAVHFFLPISSTSSLVTNSGIKQLHKHLTNHLSTNTFDLTIQASGYPDSFILLSAFSASLRLT